MKNRKVINKNIIFIIVMAFIIVIGTVGITFAVNNDYFKIGSFNNRTVPLSANITYDNESTSSINVNLGNMLPINDKLITDPDITDKRVLKSSFRVSGVSTNPRNTIYDISLQNIKIDCELLTEEIKWKLYKNSKEISSGNLSSKFDSMENNRLVLTNIQEDLNHSKDEYVFLLWISESCTGNITSCSKENDQSKYLNKNFSGTLKVELSTGSKKKLVRVVNDADPCSIADNEVE